MSNENAHPIFKGLLDSMSGEVPAENPAVISECKEPWIYWWELLTREQKYGFKAKYLPSMELSDITDTEKKSMWEQANIPPLSEDDWVALLADCLDNPPHYSLAQEKEIWRQVYRIASEHI